jgi:hypothetical protein
MTLEYTELTDLVSDADLAELHALAAAVSDGMENDSRFSMRIWCRESFAARPWRRTG